MDKGRIGISLQEPTPALSLAGIERAEALGVPAVWLTTGGAGPDALTLFAAAAVRTKTIKLGTAIVPTFPRHPLVMVQQAQVIANLAPGRLTLGIGPSHQPVIAGTFGLPFERPLEHLREYVTVLKAALHNGTVDFDGARIRAHAKVFNPAPVPVMISALRANSFQLAGAVADGAIAWICPAPYLRDVALPALQAGAAQAGRTVPPLVAHCFVAVSTDAAEVGRVARSRMGLYPRLPFYAQMFIAAGFPEAQRGEWSEGMLDAVVIHGDEQKVADGLRSFLATSGADQLIASLLPIGADAQASEEQAMRVIATL
jgi:F420-dependent oxidoreductase-like protein